MCYTGGMDKKAFYQKLYDAIGDLTPLRYDCGRLCQRACCEVRPDLPGMYLFPGEEALYGSLPGFTVQQAELTGYGPVSLLNCDGHCNREVRPLSCRIFPLAPKVTEEGIHSRVDRRGRAVCPLCREDKGALDEAFVAAVDGVFDALYLEPAIRRFLRALSDRIDQYTLSL